MSEACEVLEELVLATSETPTTDIIMVQTSVGSSASTAVTGLTPTPAVSTATTISQVVIDAYALMLNAAQASGDVSQTLVVTGLAIDAARGRSTLIGALDAMVEATANAEDEIAALDVPHLLMSAAAATSEVTAHNIALFQATDTAKVTSFASLGLTEDVLSGASLDSMVVLLRRVTETVVVNADGSEEVTASTSPQVFMLLSSGNSASMVELQSATSIAVRSTATMSSDVWYRDPSRIAWVMNTETTAMSLYDNFDFESIAQPSGKVLAVGPDGLYELAGDTDSGEPIAAATISGLDGFGTDATKRVDAMYFGYTSSGQISVDVEVHESKIPVSTYLLEQRDAGSPRNSRVVPGKGLFGRYWRMTIRNVDGADFEIHDAAVDIAVSSRRI